MKVHILIKKYLKDNVIKKILIKNYFLNLILLQFSKFGY